MKGRRLSDKEREERDARIVQMYQDGALYQDIRRMLHVSGDTIRDVTTKAGVYVCKKKRAKKERKPVPSAKVESVLSKDIADKDSCAVRPEHIAAVRTGTKVGDRMKVRSEKGVVITVGGSYIQNAVVISAKHPVFCLVRLINSGLIESVPWSDIYVAQRDRKEYVG